MSHKGIFENSDDDFESESGEDFSASEDEWKPGKDDHVSDEDEVENESSGSNDDVSDADVAGGSKKKNSKKSRAKASKKIAKAPKLISAARARQASTLRSKLFRRYNPPPKTVNKSPVPSKVADILSNSQYKERKPKMSTADKKAAVFSDSDSSDDDGLVNPSQLDFNSEFFDLKATVNRDNQSEPSAPVFDCNAGMNLSDSSDDENEEFDEVTANTPKKSSIINKINSKSSNEMHDFSSLQNFAKNLESAKAQLEKLKNKEVNASTSKSAADESDITKLLSLGEGATTSSPSGRKRKHKEGQHSDDSEWENVSDNDDVNEIKDIQITVGNTVARGLTRDQKKAIDLEACLKRRLNRDIKQRQIWLHKSAVLCWLAHGNYINSVLNNITLMKMCLKLLPSKNAYPKGDTDVKYYHMITDWFLNLFQLKSDKLYCPLKKLPPKIVSLALQLQSKKVISKCDFVLLFVTMLRSIGIQCRLVINFAVPPQQPPQKDLFVISTKPKESEDTKSKSKQLSPTPPGYITLGESLAKKIKVSANKAKQSSFKEKPSTSTSKESDKSPAPKATRSSRAKSSKLTEHSDAGPSKVKSSDSKSTKSTKSKNSSAAADHSYAQTHSFDKVKVKLSRMSQSFVTKETAVPAKKPSESSHKSPHKHTSQSPSTSKSKKQKESQEENKLSSKHEQPTNSNDKSTKVREIGNAASSLKSPTKSNTLQSMEVTHSNGTLTKHKLVERTNSIDVSKTRPKETNKESIKSSVSNEKAFSPRKTRSKASKIADVAAATKAKTKLKLPQLDGAHDDEQPNKKRAKSKASSKSRAVINVADSDSEDSDFEPTPQKRVRSKITPQKLVNKTLAKTKQHDRRVFSTDDENDVDANTVKMNFWVEAYAEKEKKWIVIDPVKRKVDCVDHVRKHATKPIIYVFAWNNDNTIRDVTPRYCSQFHTTTRRLRAEQLWIDDALDRFVEQRNPRTIIEDVEFSKLHMDTPMPTSINEFKNHPLYALERHLLKFEAIYPRNALTLGYIRNEPVYARDCVHQLHSREIWVKQARTVKVGEKPYKIVKARPKWNRVLNQMEDAKPLEIFGFWQTEPYQPPVAENGLVPRNAYGNVELFKPEMLPIGTRHIQLPNLNRVCKKMGVDCAQAVIGFDFHGGSSHPTFDGFVICEEFADDVIKQWDIEQDEQIRKETEKREARVFANWKKLIKGLLIRERLKRKFNFGVEQSPEKGHGGKRKKE